MKFFPRISFVCIVVAAGNLLALINDSVVTWSSPVIPKLLSNNTDNPLGRLITEREESLIVSLINIGAVLGSLPFGFLADKIGRKPTLLLLAVPHIVSFSIFAFAKNVYLYYFGRFFGGVSLAAVYVVFPMYIAEISESKRRGTFLVTYGLAACLGDLLSYVLGPYVSIFTFNIILAIIPIVFFVVFQILAPESPHYLVGKNDEKAEATLKRLRTSEKACIKTEMEEIKAEKDNHVKGNIWNTLTKKYVIKGAIIAFFISFFQQFSGTYPISGYTQIIFQSAEVDIPADISAIIIGVTLVISSFGSIFIIDRKGRRFLLIWSAVGMAVSEFLLGLFFYLKDKTDVDVYPIRWLPVVSLVCYTVALNIGFGPLNYAVLAEILPSNVKFLVSSVVSACGWMFSFILCLFFNDMNHLLGIHGTFWFFSIFCFLALIFVLFVVPETKGKTFQEIHKLLDGPFFINLCEKEDLKH